MLLIVKLLDLLGWMLIRYAWMSRSRKGSHVVEVGAGAQALLPPRRAASKGHFLPVDGHRVSPSVSIDLHDLVRMVGLSRQQTCVVALLSCVPQEWAE